MATLSGTSISVHGHTSVHGAPRVDTSNNQVFVCFVNFMISGTYAQSDNAQVAAVDAAILASLRCSSTITLVDAMFAAPGSEAGTPIGAKTVAVSGSDITFELTGGDLSTEHSNAALSTLTEPICLAVTYKRAPN